MLISFWHESPATYWVEDGESPGNHAKNAHNTPLLISECLQCVCHGSGRLQGPLLWNYVIAIIFA